MTDCLKKDIPYYMESSSLSDIFVTMLCCDCLGECRGRHQSNAHDFGGQKTECDYLIFN